VEGIIIYEHAGFSGDSALLTSDVDDLEMFKGPASTSPTAGPLLLQLDQLRLERLRLLDQGEAQ